MDLYGCFTFWKRRERGDNKKGLQDRYWYQISSEFPIQDRNELVQENKVIVQVLGKRGGSTV